MSDEPEPYSGVEFFVFLMWFGAFLAAVIGGSVGAGMAFCAMSALLAIEDIKDMVQK